MFISAKLTTWPRTPISPFRKKKIEAYLSSSFLRTSWLHGFASRNYRIAERICLVLLRLFTGKPIILFFPLQKEDKRGSFNLSSVAGLLLSGIILLGFLTHLAALSSRDLCIHATRPILNPARWLDKCYHLLRMALNSICYGMPLTHSHTHFHSRTKNLCQCDVT